MQLRPDIQITAMVKAMTEVVIPALDPTHKLAVEQAQLVVGMLALMAEQLPMQFRFDRDELTRLVATAGEIERQGAGQGAQRDAMLALAAQRAEAQALLAGCQVDPAGLYGAVKAMRARLCELVDAFGTGGSPAAQAVEAAVMSMTREQTLRDRALVKRQGWEADPAAIPDIASLV